MQYFRLIFLKTIFLLSLPILEVYGAPFLNYIVPIEITEPFSGIDSVDTIYMINLDRRPERLAYTKQLLSQYGLYANRVSACDGLLISETTVQELIGPYYENTLLNQHPTRSIYPAIGCFLSHLSILQDAYEREFNVIWIIEDDIKVVGDVQQIPMLLSKLFTMDPDWDICYTDQSSCYSKLALILPPGSAPFSHKVQKEARGEFDLIHWRYGTHSMLVSKNGIRKIIDYFSFAYIYGPIDNDLHLIPEIREYDVLIDIVTCGNMFKSDIER